MDAINRLATRVRLAVGRCVLAAVDDSLKLQGVTVTLLADEVRTAERCQDYGFTSHPHPGAEGVALAVGGDRSHVLVLAVGDRRYRLQGLAQGEVAMYSDEGDSIVFKRGNVIEVTSATQVVVNAPEVLVPDGDVIAQGVSLVNHTHREQGDGEPTSAPL